MVELYRCTECEKKTDNVFVVTGERISETGILFAEKGKFCFNCLKTWASRQERGVSSIKVKTYHHPDLGEISSNDVHKENGELCVKPEVYKRLKGD